MNHLVLLAGNADAALLALQGITGIPAGWPIETQPYDGVSEVPPEWQVMTDDELRFQISNTQAAYTAWRASLINPADAVVAAIKDAMYFGHNLIAEFGASNVMRSLTTTQVAQLASMCGGVIALLQTGSLYTAILAINALPADGVLITTSIKTLYRNKIQTYLGIPLT